MGPEAYKLTKEERAEVILEMKKQGREQSAYTVDIPVADLLMFYKAFKSLDDMTRMSLDEWAKVSKEDMQWITKIRDAVGLASMHAWQWLPKKEQEKLKK